MVKVNTSESRPEGGGDFFDKKCDCHFVVEGWENHLDKAKPYIEITVQSLAATDPTQVGKKRTENFSFHPKAVGKFLEWACAVGAVDLNTGRPYTKDQWKLDKENKVEPDIDIEGTIGKTFCSQIGMTPFDDRYWNDRLKDCQAAGDIPGAEKAQEQLTKNRGRSFPQLGGDKGFTFWALGDPQADHIPLDWETIGLKPTDPLPTNNGTTRRRGTTATPPAKVSPPAPAASTPPAAASMDSFV